MVRKSLPLVGALMSLLGIVWILQGFNILPGSFMTGVLFWAFAGIVFLIVGIILIVFGVRPRRTLP